MSILMVLLIGAACVWFFVYRRGGGNAPDADTPIGQLRGTGRYEFDIVGESHYQDQLEALCGGRTEEAASLRVEAFLYLEDDNRFDKKAVRVEIAGTTVGYLSRDDARSYRSQLANAGHRSLIGKCDAMVVGGWHRSQSDRGHYGVKLDLPVA